MQKLFLSLLILTAPALYAEPEIKGTPTELTGYLADKLPKTATLTGESEIKVQADKATVTLRISTENKLLQDALRANQTARGKISAALKNAGINEERIHESKFSSSPRHKTGSDKVKVYAVETIIKVTIQTEKEFQIAASLVDYLPEVHFGGLEFEYSGREKLKSDALAQACQSVLDKKKILEETLGVKLTPRRISPGEVVQNPATQTIPRAKESSWEAISSPSYSGDSSETFSFDDLTFKTQISVEFTIETK